MRMVRRAAHGGRTHSSIPLPIWGCFLAKCSTRDIFGGVVPIPWATLPPGAMGTPRAAQGVQLQPPASPTSHSSNPGLGLLSNHTTRLWAPHSNAGSDQPPNHAVAPQSPVGMGAPRQAACRAGLATHPGLLLQQPSHCRQPASLVPLSPSRWSAPLSCCHHHPCSCRCHSSHCCY